MLAELLSTTGHTAKSISKGQAWNMVCQVLSSHCSHESSDCPASPSAVATKPTVSPEAIVVTSKPTAKSPATYRGEGRAATVNSTDVSMSVINTTTDARTQFGATVVTGPASAVPGPSAV